MPHFCSGCPHNTSTRVPEGSHALGGIGCHYMATWMPDRDTDTFTQMGGEGATWLGQAPFTERKHVFQNLGDGTYFHSGLLAIRAAVSAGVNITYKILYNDAVAMTGGQPIDGTLKVEDLIYQLRGERVRRIALASDDPGRWRGRFGSVPGYSLHHRDEMDALQKELREYQGTSVIVYQQTCAAEKRRRRKKGILEDPAKRLFINDAVCEGCGDCGIKSNCLSVLPKETALGRKRQIDQSACNKDYSCVNGFCPSFVTVIGGQLKKPSAAADSGDDGIDTLFDPLPEPTLPSSGAPVEYRGHRDRRHRHPHRRRRPRHGGPYRGQGLRHHEPDRAGAEIRRRRQPRAGRRETQEDIKAVRIPAGEADLLLGADLVVTTTYEAMGKVAQGRTHAVVNEAEVPTSAFILDPDARFPTAAMKGKIAGEVGEDGCHFIDATHIATALLGDSIASNLFLLGFAWQRGLVPVSAASLEEAIELNAVAVDFNKQAFLWGRRCAHQPEKVQELVELNREEPKPMNLDEVVADRASRLTALPECGLCPGATGSIRGPGPSRPTPRPGSPQSLAMSAARQLYKLMAYKDEYEVARLYSNGEFQRKLQSQFEGDYELRFNLAPPLFSKRDPNTGHLIKQEFGPWMMTAFSWLAKLRFLRGGRFDIFGYSDERRQERADIDDYRQLLDELLAGLTQQNYATALELAQLPGKLRGFGHVKDRNREQLAVRKAELLRQFRGEASSAESQFINAVEVA